MKNTVLRTLLCAAMMSYSLSAVAGGSSVNGGGTSIVCFSIPLEQAMKDGHMTPAGAESIRSAQVLEFYLASLKRNHSSPFFQRIAAGDPQGALAELQKRIELVPEFAEAIAQNESQLGKVGDGIAVPTYLDRIEDTDLMIGLPEGCAQVQTVARRSGMFFYDAAIWNAFERQDSIQQAIMQTHEMIYSVSPRTRLEISSVPTQTLLISIMSDPMDREILSRRLRDLGFRFQYPGGILPPPGPGTWP